MTKITDLRVFDLRFPTSQSLDGSDAMNPDPDYSAAYVILDTDEPGLKGHGLTFTIGRGNDGDHVASGKRTAIRCFFHGAGKLVAHDARVGKIGLVASEDVQIRTADAYAANAHQHFTFTAYRFR